MNEPLISLDKVIAQARLAQFPTATLNGGWIAPLLEEAEAVQRSVVKGDWPEVVSQSARCLGFGYAALRWLEGGSLSLQRRSQDSQRVNGFFADFLREIARSDRAEVFFTNLSNKIQIPNADEIIDASIEDLKNKVADKNIPDTVFSELREELKQNMSRTSDIAESFEKLAQGKTNGVPFLNSLDARLDPSLRVIFETAIACLSKGLLAWVHAEFNLAAERHLGALVQDHLLLLRRQRVEFGSGHVDLLNHQSLATHARL